jgi:hypothetical protein
MPIPSMTLKHDFRITLLASTMLLPIGIASAQPYEPNTDYGRSCVAKYCYDDELLVESTPVEQEEPGAPAIIAGSSYPKAGTTEERTTKMKSSGETTEPITTSQKGISIMTITPERKHPWRDYNGPGKPIAQQQMEEILARDFGVKPDANGYFHRKDFEAAFKYYLGDKRS